MSQLWLLCVLRLAGAGPGLSETQWGHATVAPHTAPHVSANAGEAKARVVPRYGGTGPESRKSAKGAKGTSGGELKSLLDIGLDPKDPHADGFEPRPGPEEGGSMWAFGRAHAAVHHVLQHAVEGNASDVASVLDAFSAKHGLLFGLGASRGGVLEDAVRRKAEAAQVAAKQGLSRLNILILRAGLGGGTLRCLPPLLNIGNPGSVYEVVSVESDHHLSDGSARLVSHALSTGDAAHGAHDIRHTPLMPSEDTVLEEVLESLHDGYELKGFDVVVLGGSRADHRQDLETLLESGALRPGAILHSDGPARGDEGTEKYIEFLQGSGGRLDYEVHEITAPSLPGQDGSSTGSNAAVVVATLGDGRRGGEL